MTEMLQKTGRQFETRPNRNRTGAKSNRGESEAGRKRTGAKSEVNPNAHNAPFDQ